jgi:sec-independent protein translocase protein TatC
MQVSSAIGSIGHEDRLTVVGHLDELRMRLIVSLLGLGVAFGICFSQNQRLLHLIDAPLAHQTQQQVRAGHGPLGATYRVAQASRDVAIQLRAVVATLTTQGDRAALTAIDASLGRDIARLSAPPAGDKPVTLGIGEPFTTTVTVSLIFALILSLPIWMAQAYAFLMPALAPEQRRRMRPLAFAVPGLFVAGVTFGYFVVLPAAVHFLQNFNSSEFNVLVQANQYYDFASTGLLTMGLVFQIPIAILAVTRAGLIAPSRLRRNRRYALALCAVVACAMPGDAITMVLETAPLYLLFEIGVLLAALIERRAAQRAAAPNRSGLSTV